MGDRLRSEEEAPAHRAAPTPTSGLIEPGGGSRPYRALAGPWMLDAHILFLSASPSTPLWFVIRKTRATVEREDPFQMLTA